MGQLNDCAETRRLTKQIQIHTYRPKKCQKNYRDKKEETTTRNETNNQKLTIQKTLTEEKKSEKRKIKMNTET